jgi:2-C-methyl-D-erythritol 4-phosphate cytidylyltransferase
MKCIKKALIANKMDVIIAAGGIGKRFNFRIPKQFVNLNGKPMFLHSVETFLSLSFVNKIIIAVPREILPAVSKKYKALNKKVLWTAGGKERFDSVKKGLELVDKDSNFIAVHDGARPLIDKRDIKAVFVKAVKLKAAIAAQKTKDTIKAVKDGKIIKTLERKILWNAQTPQIFRKDILLKAYSAKILPDITDDAGLVEKIGVKVFIEEVKYPNFKITTKEDFQTAKIFLEGVK